MLQCVAVCCSVLQYVAVCCNMLQCIALSISPLTWSVFSLQHSRYICILFSIALKLISYTLSFGKLSHLVYILSSTLSLRRLSHVVYSLILRTPCCIQCRFFFLTSKSPMWISLVSFATFRWKETQEIGIEDWDWMTLQMQLAAHFLVDTLMSYTLSLVVYLSYTLI